MFGLRELDVDKDAAHTSMATRLFSVVGLICVVSLGAVSLIALTAIMPPWLKVKCQRQEVLYYSTVVEDYETSFAGYHGLLTSQDWQTEKSWPTTSLTSGQVFDVTEYRIFWRLLIGEWILISILAGGVFLLVSIRLYLRPKHPVGMAEQSGEPESPSPGNLLS